MKNINNTVNWLGTVISIPLIKPLIKSPTQEERKKVLLEILTAQIHNINNVRVAIKEYHEMVKLDYSLAALTTAFKNLRNVLSSAAK